MKRKPQATRAEPRVESHAPCVYDAEMQTRLWAHRTATNGDFHTFANFFLLAQSILLATTGTLLGSATSPRLVLYVLMVLGVTLDGVWILVQSKQRRLLSLLKVRCEREFAEYRETKLARTGVFGKVSNIWLLTYFVPSVFGIAWLLIAYTIVFRIRV